MAHLATLSSSMWMWLFIKISNYHTFIVVVMEASVECMCFNTNAIENHWKNSLFEMIFKKLVTWYNMFQTMWNDMVQYTFNFHKN
jgi:hypothetical protein